MKNRYNQIARIGQHDPAKDDTTTILVNDVPQEAEEDEEDEILYEGAWCEIN